MGGYGFQPRDTSADHARSMVSSALTPSSGPQRHRERGAVPPLQLVSRQAAFRHRLAANEDHSHGAMPAASTDIALKSAFARKA